MQNRYIVDWDKYARIARQAAAEGAVLLKNEHHALPLNEGIRLSVFGRIQFDYYKSGTGSGGMVNTRYIIGIPEALRKENLTLNTTLEQIYLDWIKEHPFDHGTGWAQDPWSQEEMPLDEAVVADAAAVSDAALVIIGRTAGEDRDAANEPGSFLLTQTEEDMLSKVCAAFSRVIVVLNVGNIIDMSWVEKYRPQAVLYTWQGGMEGGHAVADVLMGRVNPCGRLSDTIARSIADYPSTENFGGENGNLYAEDIYVGYRYFETFAKEKVLYPFGFGLSYTTFEKTVASVEHGVDSSAFTVSVKNTGSVAGKESVLLYVSAPQGLLGKPARSLVAFTKTALLQPGDTQELTLCVSDDTIASYDDSGITGHRSCYVLEKGHYEFYLGGDVRSAAPIGGFDAEETIVIKECTEALAPTVAFDRLKPVANADATFSAVYEPVLQRTYSMKERMEADEMPEIPFTGDRGYVLADVYDKKITMEAFVAQFTDEDLFCIVRGEGMCSPRVTPGTAAAFGGVSDGLAKLGIPAACCSDGPSGIRMDCGTMAFSLPNGTCLACSFNEELSRELYRMEGAELRKNHIEILLGPGMNIHRNPLNGRNFEYFSEDPLLTGRMAAAQLQGMQEFGVTGAIKHFAANNQEHRRRFYNSVVSERALREIYLKGFEIAVKEGQAFSVMSTYGAINGLWTASNYDLLVTILRKEWGFDGFVMTDWWAEMNEEGEDTASMKNVAAMVKSRNDVFMVVQQPQENTNDDNLAESLANGTLKRSALQRCAMTLLDVILRLPVMDRHLGRLSEDELAAAEIAEAENAADLNVEFHKVDGSLALSGAGLDTSRGSTLHYGIEIAKPGIYRIRFKMKADAGDLAQLPISVFVNNVLKATVTINGTHGEWIEREVVMDRLMNPHNFVKLYFAQAGITIDTLWFELTQEL
ncbi:MAG: glycoside hydrolase family 3 C-terminal domain-containing protein [Eubacteriales bacterium]|nr:glycoside hydrolase family 3 C-terminal domain-containing protein [Eubacteriales bacterium]